MSRPTVRGRRRRRRRAHRRVRAAARVRRHALRGGAPPRRPRAHPRRRRRRRPRRPDRQRVHRAQPPHVPQPAAPVRRARGGDPADRDEHVGALRRLRARVRGRPRARRRLRPAGQRGAPALPPHAGGGEALPPRAPDGCSTRRRRTDATPDPGRLPRRRPLLAVLRAALHGAAGVVRVVVRAPHRARCIPRATCSRSSITTGCSSVSGSPQWRTVVGGSRSYVERAAKELTATELSTPVAQRRAESPSGIEIRDDADDRAHASTRPSSPPTPTRPSRCSPTRPPRSARRSARSRTRRNETVLHTDASVLPTHRAGARVVELPARRVRGDGRRGAGQLRHEPSAAARRDRSTTSSR